MDGVNRRLKLTSAKVDFEVELERELGKIRCSYWVSPFLAQNYTFSVRWVGGECEDTANSTQVVAEVEVRFELGNVIE